MFNIINKTDVSLIFKIFFPYLFLTQCTIIIENWTLKGLAKY